MKITLEIEQPMISVLDRLLVYEIEDQATWNEDDNAKHAETRALIVSQCYDLLDQLEKQTGTERFFMVEYKERG